MKKIKFKQSKKIEDIAEVCQLASKYFYVTVDSPDSPNGELEVADCLDSNVDEALDLIRAEMTTENQFKKSDNRVIKKILKDNYHLVELYGEFQLTKTAANHSWDNAVFNGAN